MAKSQSLQLNYWQQEERPNLAPIGGKSGHDEYHPECIVVDKVYDECTVTECPT